MLNLLRILKAKIESQVKFENRLNTRLLCLNKSFQLSNRALLCYKKKDIVSVIASLVIEQNMCIDDESDESPESEIFESLAKDLFWWDSRDEFRKRMARHLHSYFY